MHDSRNVHCNVLPYRILLRVGPGNAAVVFLASYATVAGTLAISANLWIVKVGLPALHDQVIFKLHCVLRASKPSGYKGWQGPLNDQSVGVLSVAAADPRNIPKKASLIGKERDKSGVGELNRCIQPK